MAPRFLARAFSPPPPWAELTRAVAGWPSITLMTKHLSDSQTLAMIAEAM